MKLKTLSTAALIAFTIVFSLPAYSNYNHPSDTYTRWQSHNSAFDNTDVQQLGMVASRIKWQLLKAQEKIQEELMQLNEETKEMIQFLSDQNLSHGARKICLDPIKCPQYSPLRQLRLLCRLEGIC
jgi:hypothetical protein